MRFTPKNGVGFAVRAAIAAAAVGGALIALPAAPALAGWQPAATVDSGGAGYGASTKDAVAAGSNGTASILFFQQPPGGSGFSGTPFMIRRAAGATTSWSDPAPVTTGAGEVNGTTAPQLAALDDGGTVGAFAFNPSGGGTQTLSTRWPAGSTGPEDAVQMLCTSGGTPECAAADPDVALDGDGNAYAVGSMLSGANGDVLFARTDQTTGDWEAADVIAQGFFPQLAVDPAGDVVVTYQRADTSNPLVTVDRLYAKRKLASDPGFGSEHQLSGANTVGPISAVAIGAFGNATAVFAEDSAPSIGPLPNAGVIQAVSWAHDDSAPGAEQQISDDAADEGNASAPSLAQGAHGRLAAAWQANSGPSGAIYAARQSAGTWHLPTQISPEGTNDTYSSPQVGIDPSGTSTVVYYDTEPPPSSATHLLAQRKVTLGPWSPAVSLDSTMPGAGSVIGDSAHVAVARTAQADVAFIQDLGGTNRLFATRWVDTTPPNTTITAGPSGLTHDSTPTFQFTSSEAGSTFRCKVDSHSYAPCTSPHTTRALVDGSHVFYVQAVDASGNRDPSPAHRAFRIETP